MINGLLGNNWTLSNKLLNFNCLCWLLLLLLEKRDAEDDDSVAVVIDNGAINDGAVGVG